MRLPGGFLLNLHPWCLYRGPKWRAWRSPPLQRAAHKGGRFHFASGPLFFKEAGLDSDVPGLRSATLNWAGGQQRMTHQEEEGMVLPGGHPLRPVPNARGEEVSYEKTGEDDILAGE